MVWDDTPASIQKPLPWRHGESSLIGDTTEFEARSRVRENEGHLRPLVEVGNIGVTLNVNQEISRAFLHFQRGNEIIQAAPTDVAKRRHQVCGGLCYIATRNHHNYDLAVLVRGDKLSRVCC